MPVNRSAPTPPFYQYLTEYVLVDSNGGIPASVQAAHLFNLKPLHIPTFQRGITWGVDEVLEFLYSRSQVMGHAVLAKTQTTTGWTELVDGLQRFTVGTALLHVLHPLVLSSTASQQASKQLFAPIANYTNNCQAVFDSNHQQLFNHPRRAIQEQYREFHDALDTYVKKLFVPPGSTNLPRFASAAVNTFCGRQIAIDDFTGFVTMGELVSTFLGINTIRVDLNTVDLLRTYIVEKATGVWNPADIEAVENSLTDVFVMSGAASKSVMPIATAVQRSLDVHAANIFPNWAAGSSRSEVDGFLDFTDSCLSGAAVSAYLSEISEVGSLPFSLVVLCYYRQFVQTHAVPSFAGPAFAGPYSTEDPDLHYFLRACYRALLSGTVGQLGPIAEDLISAGTPMTLRQVADSISAMTGAGSMHAGAPSGWVSAQLESVNKDKAKRVLNACLLPTVAAPGGPFTPLRFGRSTGRWQIDHLIPETTINGNLPGVVEANRIRNFAPILSQFNKGASNLPCSQKLTATGTYIAQSTYLATQQIAEHPYLVHLRSTLPTPTTELDDQSKLVPNATPQIGDGRLAYLATLLTLRL